MQTLEKEGFIKDDTVTFKKIDSHTVKGNQNEDEKKQYKVNDKESYPQGIYNDLVDILAKAESGVKIKRQEDFNVFRAIPDEFKGFAATPDADKRRKNAGHARELVEKVIEKYDGIFRPKF